MSRLIAPLLSVLLLLVSSLLVVRVGPLLVVVVLKVRLLPVPRTIVVDEAHLFLAFQTINLIDLGRNLLNRITHKVHLLLLSLVGKKQVHFLLQGLDLFLCLLIITSVDPIMLLTVDRVSFGHVLY